MPHWTVGSLLTLAFLTMANVSCPQEASPQTTERTLLRFGGAFTRAFGEDAWGGTVGLTHGLFSGAIPLGGLGVDLTWARAQLVGEPTAGLRSHRDLASMDVHLRTRVFRRPLALELGLPVGLVWSRVAEAAVEQTDPEAVPENLPGTEWGGSAGVLASLRAPLGSRASVFVESRVVRAWMYESAHWFDAHSLGIQARLW